MAHRHELDLKQFALEEMEKKLALFTQQKSNQEDNFVKQKQLLIDEIIKKEKLFEKVYKENQLVHLQLQSYEQHIKDFNRRYSKGQ